MKRQQAERMSWGVAVALEAAAEVEFAAFAAFEQDTNRPRKARRTHLEATVLVGTGARGSSRTSRIPSGAEAHNPREGSALPGRTKRLRRQFTTNKKRK
jgi:hypothetical protein